MLALVAGIYVFVSINTDLILRSSKAASRRIVQRELEPSFETVAKATSSG
jgi:hypothetical protein